MQMSGALIVVAAGPALLVGCAAQATKPALDVASETVAIEKVVSDQLAGTRRAGAAGADGYVSTASEDLVVLPPNAPRVEGRTAVRDWALQFTSAPEWSVSFKTDRVEVAASGDLAYATGSYEFSFKDASGTTVSDRGKFLDAFRKPPGGSWQITVISYGSDLPAGGAPDPSTAGSRPAGGETGAAQDRQAVLEAHARLARALEKDDLEGLFAGLTVDHVTMPPDEPSLPAAKDLRAWHERRIAAYALRGKWRAEHVQLAGDWAIETWGGPTSLTPRGGGAPIESVTKGVWVWHRESDGTWKLARSIWNSDSPGGLRR